MPLSIPNLSTKTLGRAFFHLTAVDSTQNVLRKMAGEGATHGTVLLADHQHAGRGRQGRKWFSLPPPQFYVSLLLQPPIDPIAAPILSIAAGLAVSEAMDVVGILGSRVRWPNDVCLDGRKVCGILAETVPPRKPFPSIILGVGINLVAQKKDFPPELREWATALSLHSPSGVSINRLILLAAFLEKFEKLYDEVLRQESSSIQIGFQNRSLHRNRTIEIQVGNEILRGVADEIDVDGALLLRVPARGIVRIVSGEIHPF